MSLIDVAQCFGAMTTICQGSVCLCVQGWMRLCEKLSDGSEEDWVDRISWLILRQDIRRRLPPRTCPRTRTCSTFRMWRSVWEMVTGEGKEERRWKVRGEWKKCRFSWESERRREQEIDSRGILFKRNENNHVHNRIFQEERLELRLAGRVEVRILITLFWISRLSIKNRKIHEIRIMLHHAFTIYWSYLPLFSPFLLLFLPSIREALVPPEAVNLALKCKTDKRNRLPICH